MDPHARKPIRRVTGSLPFGAWVHIYEERDQSIFELDEGEELYFDRDLGFFTWQVDPPYLLIPKMVGNGRVFRPIVLEMFLRLRDVLGLKAVYCCTKRNPKAYMRLLGGRLVKQEVEDGKTYSYIEITPEDTNVRRCVNGTPPQ